MHKLVCEVCQTEYEKPKWYQEQKGVFFRHNLKYCDKCRREKELKALQRLPEILKILSNGE